MTPEERAKKVTSDWWSWLDSQTVDPGVCHSIRIKSWGRLEELVAEAIQSAYEEGFSEKQECKGELDKHEKTN